MTRIRSGAGAGLALTDFGPDAVILDPSVLDGQAAGMLQALADSGAHLLLLGGPDDRATRVARELAAAEDVAVAGILAKPVSPEGFEVALRAASKAGARTAPRRWHAGSIPSLARCCPTLSCPWQRQRARPPR